MAQRRIKVRGIRRAEIDEDKLALAYWLLAKTEVESQRKREAQEKTKTRGKRRPDASESSR